MPPDLLLPAGAGLLHIGPHKTGSTALQDAFDQARDELRAQGVVYLSRGRHDANAARYVTGRLVPGQDEAAAARRWQRIVHHLSAGGPRRKLFSSEFLSDATDDQVGGIASQVGPDTHVAVTLRPLANVLPSQYQQYVQRGSTFSYESWLDGMLRRPPYDKPTPSFWKRHRHDELVERWAARFSVDRVVVIVMDGRDFAFGPRSFEALLGLAPGTLTGREVSVNRSMTWAEAEMMRAVNLESEGSALSAAERLRLVQTAAAYVRSRDPGPGEAKIGTPPWAVERANEIGAAMVERIRSSGVTVIGDLDLLSSAAVPDIPHDAPTTVDLSLAARFATGFALGAERVITQAAAVARPS